MTTALLSTTYFGPVQWYQKVYRYDRVMIEHHETFQKQTYRNRCLIATTQGVQALTVPVKAPSISSHGNWRHVHWQALQSAYGESPFFEFYEDDLRPFFFEDRWDSLYEFNWDICKKMCGSIDIKPHITPTKEYIKSTDSIGLPVNHDIVGSSNAVVHDFRDVIRPKHPLPDADFQPRPYYQVYRQKHGFLPNLSILDLLFNMGPESVFYL